MNYSNDLLNFVQNNAGWIAFLVFVALAVWSERR
jgi:hypothetical protein